MRRIKVVSESTDFVPILRAFDTDVKRDLFQKLIDGGTAKNVIAGRCDFTLEPFTRGLASEDADEHSQRFVALIARRALPWYAPTPLVAQPDAQTTGV